MIEYRGGDPWLLLTCGTCNSHAFGVQSAEHGLVHMYDITQEQLETLSNYDRRTKAWVILEYLGYMEIRDADAERALAAAMELQHSKAGK